VNSFGVDLRAVARLNADMKSLLPLGLLAVGIFAAGCTTPEDVFLGAPTPVAVATQNPTPATTNPDVVPTNSTPAAPVVVVEEKPAPVPVEAKPVVAVTNTPPPVVVVANPPPVAPVVVVPDNSVPAETRPAVARPLTDPDALPTIVTPDNSVTGRVVSYNSAGRFVLLNFPSGPVPKPDQTLSLYRHGLKIGEVKITGPQRETITVADVITGDAQVDDEARTQ